MRRPNPRKRLRTDIGKDSPVISKVNKHPRMVRERQSINAMILIYCHAHHGRKLGLCEECLALSIYAHTRLNCCPYQEKKPTCGKCPIHCYKPRMRDKVKQVMRYAGRRMLWRHPLLALLHMLSCRRTPPARSSSF